MPLELPDFNYSEEQIEFRDTLRRYFEENAPIAEVRRVMEPGTGFSPAVWKGASSELGLAGLAIPEAYGGQGFGVAELALALGESGRCLAPLPLFASAGLAARVVEAVCDSDEAGEWLGAIAQGSAATLSWVDEGGGWDPVSTGVVAVGESEEAGAPARLRGMHCFVLDAPEAERVFVVARREGSSGEEGLGLYAVDSGADGLEIARRESLDLTRPLSTIRFADTPARRVGSGEITRLRQGLDEATALLVAEMVGGMGMILETAVNYSAERHQFSRPIGSFQAIKHKCADLLIDYEAARTSCQGALAAIETNDPQRALLIPVAKSFVGPAYLRMTNENMQIQGGVGYTWEYDAHLYYRRALSGEAMLGNSSFHQERLAERVAAGVGQDAQEAQGGQGE